jgi:hypothetical protein
MKTVAALAVAALLLVSALAMASGTDDRAVCIPSIGDGATTATGNIKAGTYDLLFDPSTGAQCIYDELGATCGTRTDDANSITRTVNTSDVYPFAAAAKTPGNLVMRGGLDSKTIGCTQATCDGTDTVIVTRIINGTSTANTLTYGTDFCTGTVCTDPATATLDNEAMAASLADAIEALSGVGSTASGAECSGGAANSRCTGVTADRLTSSIVITDSNAHAACTVISLGTDGLAMVGGMGFQPYLGTTGVQLTDLAGVSNGFVNSSHQWTFPDNVVGGAIFAQGAGAMGFYGRQAWQSSGTGSSNVTTTTSTLPACVVGTIGTTTWYSKANKVYPCFCTQSGAGTYAWVGNVAADDCT